MAAGEIVTASWARTALRALSLRRLGITLAGIAWLELLRSTTTSAGDPFDAPLYQWGYVILPAIAAVGTLLRVEGSPWAWAMALIGPAAVWTFVVGGIAPYFVGDQQGLWIVGEMFLVALGGLVAGGSLVGDQLGVALRRKRVPRCASCGAEVLGEDKFCRSCGAKR